MPLVEAGLAEQRRLLVAGDAGDRDAAGQRGGARRRSGRSSPRGAADLGQRPERHAEQVGQLGRPGQVADVEEQRAAGVGRLGGVLAPAARSAGQVPQHPGVDRAEGQVVVRRSTPPSVSSHATLVAQK